MLRSDLRTRVRELSSVGTSNVSDTTLNDLLNEGIRVVAKTWQWPFLHTEVNLSTTAAQEQYSLVTDLSVSDFSSIKYVYDQDEQRVLQPITYEQRVRWWAGDPDTATKGEWFYMTETASHVGIMPIPSATESNAYKFVYSKAPTEMSADGNSPEWDEAYHQILVSYVLAQVYESQEFYTQAQTKIDQFSSGMAEMKRFYNSNRIPSMQPVVFNGGISRGSRPWDNYPQNLYFGWRF